MLMYKTMLSKKKMTPIVWRPWKRKGTRNGSEAIVTAQLIDLTSRDDVGNASSGHGDGEISPRDMFDALLPRQLLGRIWGQFIRVICPVAVVGIVAEVSMFAVHRRR